MKLTQTEKQKAVLQSPFVSVRSVCVRVTIVDARVAASPLLPAANPAPSFPSAPELGKFSPHEPTRFQRHRADQRCQCVRSPFRRRPACPPAHRFAGPPDVPRSSRQRRPHYVASDGARRVRKESRGRRVACGVQRCRQGGARGRHGLDAGRKARAEHRLRGKHHRPPRGKRCVAPSAALRLAHRLGSGRRQLRRASRIDLGYRGRADVGRALDRDSASARGRDLAERGGRTLRQSRGERPGHHARAQDGLEQRQDRRRRNPLHRWGSGEARRGEARQGIDRRLLRAAHRRSRAERSTRRGQHRRRGGNRRVQAVGGHRHRF